MGPYANNRSGESDPELERRVQEAVAQWIAALADQIKNPVAGIGAALEIVRREIDGWPQAPSGPDRQPVMNTLDQIHKRLFQLDRYVSELINYTRPMTPQITRLDASDLLQNALNDATHLVPIARSYVIDDALNGVLVNADRAMLTAALAAVIVNGLQAVPVDREPLLKLNVALSEDRQWVEFKLTDNGTGFKPDDLQHPERLFEPFQTQKEAGNGLGLAVAQKMVAAHGGQILLANRRDESGAEITIRIPVTTASSNLKTEPKS